MKELEEQGVNHIISYMDGIYIYKVVDNTKTKASDIKTEDKNNSGIHSIFNKYLSGEVKSYADHEYLSKHFKPESCMLTAIIETYWAEFRKKKPDGKRRHKEDITYEYLCELFGLECTESHISCNIQTALAFFKKFNLGLKVYDIYMNIVEEYEPPNKTVHITPRTCHLLTYNKHIYSLNDNLWELYQKSGATELESISNQYNIITEFDTDYKLCQSLEDVKELVDSYEPGGDKKDHTLNIQYYGNMNQLAYQIVFEEQYMPHVCLDGAMVSRICLLYTSDAADE